MHRYEHCMKREIEWSDKVLIMISVSITSKIHDDIMPCSYNVMRKAFQLCRIWKTHKPCLIMRKYQANPNRGNWAKYLTKTIQKCEGHEKQWKTQKLWEIGGDYSDMTTKYKI